MKSTLKISFFSIIFFCFTSNNLYSQQSELFSYPFNDFTDTKSAAMGFTAVSNPYSPMSYKENPANLSFDNDWNIYGGSYGNNFTVSTSTNWKQTGIAIDYSETDYFGLFTPLGFVSNNDQFYSLTLSRKLIDNFSFGSTISVFSFSKDVSYKLNFGGLYKFENLFNISHMKNELYVGFAINNIGPDLKSGFTEVYLPIYASIGSTVRFLSANKSLFAYEFEFSVKYKNYLNPEDVPSNYYFNEKNYRDYWGIGFNLTLFNLISLRDGFYKTPIRDNFLHTSGIGIYIPPKDLKFSISLEYMRFWKHDYFLGNGSKNFASINLSYAID